MLVEFSALIGNLIDIQCVYVALRKLKIDRFIYHRKEKNLPPVRIELTTAGLQDQRSATELRRLVQLCFSKLLITAIQRNKVFHLLTFRMASCEQSISNMTKTFL